MLPLQLRTVRSDEIGDVEAWATEAHPHHMVRSSSGLLTAAIWLGDTWV